MRVKKIILIFILLILLVVIGNIFVNLDSLSGVKDESKTENEICIIDKVLDGDTISCNGEKIRLLGINTPEKGKYLSGEALLYLNSYLNKQVELEKDNEDIDRYGRKLRYVHKDSMILNVEILQTGLATSFILDGLKYKDKLVDAENFAQANNIGLWKKSNDSCSLCIILKEIEPVQEYFVIENICLFDCKLTGWIVKDDANHFIKIKPLNKGESEKYISETKIWNDNHDRFFLRDSNGLLVIYKEY